MQARSRFRIPQGSTPKNRHSLQRGVFRCKQGSENPTRERHLPQPALFEACEQTCDSTNSLVDPSGGAFLAGLFPGSIPCSVLLPATITSGFPRTSPEHSAPLYGIDKEARVAPKGTGHIFVCVDTWDQQPRSTWTLIFSTIILLFAQKGLQTAVSGLGRNKWPLTRQTTLQPPRTVCMQKSNTCAAHYSRGPRSWDEVF